MYKRIKGKWILCSCVASPATNLRGGRKEKMDKHKDIMQREIERMERVCAVEDPSPDQGEFT